MKVNSALVVVYVGTLAAAVQADPYLTVLPPGYYVETYAVIPTPDPAYRPSGITSDSYGNIYLSHPILGVGTPEEPSGAIYRIAPDRTVTTLVENTVYPRKMVWAGGSDYGDYLYIASGQWGNSSRILRSDLSGNVAPFASISRAPHALALDTTGNYGGYMYTATRAFDRTYRIKPDGSVSLFSQFPKPAEDGGGPIDIAFDPGTAYGGLMYMCTDYLGNENSGLFLLDPSGTATRFAEMVLGGFDVEIDPRGLFSGSMFITARVGPTRDDPFSMYQVSPDGGLSEFARGAGDSPLLSPDAYAGLTSFTFGPDGAMYIPQLFLDEGVIVISRVAPVPTPGAALLCAIGLSMAGWRLRHGIIGAQHTYFGVAIGKMAPESQK